MNKEDQVVMIDDYFDDWVQITTKSEAEKNEKTKEETKKTEESKIRSIDSHSKNLEKEGGKKDAKKSDNCAVMPAQEKQYVYYTKKQYRLKQQTRSAQNNQIAPAKAKIRGKNSDICQTIGLQNASL